MRRILPGPPGRTDDERRKEMRLTPYIPVVAMISVLVMFIWMFIDSDGPSWVAVVIGGVVIVAMVIIDAVMRKR